LQSSRFVSRSIIDSLFTRAYTVEENAGDRGYVEEGVMAWANVRGANIHYEVMGDRGTWVALSPGGRRGLDGVLSLGKRIADAGYRVLLHDRRNCGESDVVIDGEDAEFEIWADDLYELLTQLDAKPAFAGGSSSGCRLALLL